MFSCISCGWVIVTFMLRFIRRVRVLSGRWRKLSKCRADGADVTPYGTNKKYAFFFYRKACLQTKPTLFSLPIEQNTSISKKRDEWSGCFILTVSHRNRTFRSGRFGLADLVWPFRSEQFRSGPFRSGDISVWPFRSGDNSVTTFLYINNLLHSFI